ncbi:hypothetical protein [Paenibacillus sp. LC231]|uniref:hypothetical protein n=1 Tax=Paenibacillus sp. LC231 TaxID=1120679 RepID=UPI001913CE46|nr:hypothetical protein [Paenibacillus sp. LC231]
MLADVKWATTFEIPGYSIAETTDESPERVALIQWLTLDYLRTSTIPAGWQLVRLWKRAPSHWIVLRPSKGPDER